MPRTILGTVEDGVVLTVTGEEHVRMNGFSNWLKVKVKIDGVIKEGYIAKLYTQPVEGAE